MRVYEIVEVGLVATEAAACIVGFSKWDKIKNTYWKWFVFYLALIVSNEITGLSMLYIFKAGGLSREFYNYFVIPVEFLFYFWLYYQYLKNNRSKYWPLAGAAIYILSWLLNVLFFRNVNFWIIPFSYMVGVVVLLVLVILFFYRFISGSEILQYKYNMMFWVSLGLLLFFLVSSPFFALRQILYDGHRDIFWLYYYLQFGVNYLMYIFFIISFVWGKPH